MNTPQATLTQFAVGGGEVTLVATITLPASRWIEIIREQGVERTLIHGQIGQKKNVSRSEMGRVLQRVGKLMCETQRELDDANKRPPLNPLAVYTPPRKIRSR